MTLPPDQLRAAAARALAPCRSTTTSMHAESVASVLDALGVSADRGLSEAEATERRARFGRNVLRRTPPRSALRILIDQLSSLMVALLAAAAVLAYLLIDWVEGTAILVVILINTAIGFGTELKARRTMESLYRLGQVTARVRRSGVVRLVDAADLVPGDIVVCEAGDVITADLRIVEGSNLQVDESALTGESVPVAKSTLPVAPETVLAERSSMLFKGTAITRGAGEAVVVATGLETEIGRISALVMATDDTATPLERRLERLGRRLIWVTLGIVAALASLGIAGGRDVVLVLETSIALAVATVPEGLPIVATIALARGMWRMAQHNALINRLSAVETLGATGVICTDKTGTLTENRMTVARLALPGGDVRFDANAGRFVWAEGARADKEPELRTALELATLCSDSSLGPESRHAGPGGLGDPMEVALLLAARAAGIERAQLLVEQPELRAEAFETDRMMMATLHRRGDRVRIAVKGAPESVLAACSWIADEAGRRPLDDNARRYWQERNESLAREGLRVIALAERECDDLRVEPYRDLSLVALIGLVDPPRHDVRAAVDRCRSAGIELVMVTGDQPQTARYVAREVGLISEADAPVVMGEQIRPPEELSEEYRQRLRSARIFARVTPKQKLDLIALHQRAGMVVAMTGDGVNDAPALKKADIGVAMGRRGTQVAREAADMVLTDDALGSIVLAVEQGRIIFGNIRQFVLYLLSCNVSEVMVIALATLAQAPLPILPLQILFLNLVTDVFPALALGVGPGDPGLMKRAPRPSDEPVLTRAHWFAVAGYGFLLTVSVLLAFGWALVGLALDLQAAVTISFLTLAFAQLWHVFNMRESSTSILRNDVMRNGWIWAALALCVALLATATYYPPLARILSVTVPDAYGWSLILGCSALPLVIGQAVKLSTRQ